MPLIIIIIIIILYCLSAVNTPAAELLYTLISDLCRISYTTTLVDVCCGTGTIGLTLAKVQRTFLYIPYIVGGSELKIRD